MAPTGKVSEIRMEIDIEWKIENFSLLEEDGRQLCCPTFFFAGASWFFSFCPNGDSEADSEAFISILLVRQTPGPPISLELSFGLKTVEKKIQQKKHFTKTFDDRQVYGTFQLLSRVEFLERKSELVTDDDVITVFCTARNPKSDARIEKLTNDLEGLMKSGDDSDTTIKVKGVEFRLHRNILRARSNFFNLMFKNEMRESVTDIVSIDDCEPDIFHSFIHFLYTGKVEELSVENVCDLYEVADKYQEDKLLNECVQFMMNSLSVDNFCDFVILALRYDEKELLDRATKFFFSHHKRIILHVKWISFMKEYSVCAHDMYIKALVAYQNLLCCTAICPNINS